MSNILNWPDYKVLQVTELEHDYQVHAEVSEQPTYCPHCNYSEIIGFGRRDEVIMDTPVHGKRRGIMLNRRRYRCQSCRKTFLEPVPHKDDKRQMTDRLIQYIERESLRRTFSGVAEDVGVDEKTVRNIFADYCERLEKTLKFEMPQWLGIDEIHIIKPRCVITNIEQQTIVDILDNRSNTTVTRYLSMRKDRDQVRYVAMEMWEPYRQAVETMLPEATVVIDKFHVVRMANESLERARKAIRSALTPQQRRGLMRDRFVLLKRRHELTAAESLRLYGWTLNYPEIGQAYELKESFFEIWNCKNRHQAQEAYYVWLRRITPDMKTHFDPLIKAISNWHDDIFAYFDHPITNAYTESLNNLIRVVNLVGRGYSFEALRARILFTEGLQKIKKPHYQLQRKPEDAMGKMPIYAIAETGPATIHGVDISILAKEIEAGHL
ncbi:ISL3 family transposase [Erwinia mallotivora]|uniref:Transposase n=1 Tax=Erwinia mallotivora TaxID=69222 RepID=A0A014PWP8_9GAMM|nr:ISL3 family transposase [Erwinia mallotivora]EXU75307.1 transposase [Erwinia mallotivora]